MVCARTLGLRRRRSRRAAAYSAVSCSYMVGDAGYAAWTSWPASAPSIDSAPPPLMRSAIARPSASRWYSNPSPFWVPPQFMKKPTLECTSRIAPSITQPIPRAARRGRKPPLSSNPPPSSPATIRTAMTRFLGWDRPAAARCVLALLFLVSAPAGFANAAAPAGDVRIHYHRDGGDYAGWQLYTWYGALNPSPQWNPAQPNTGTDGFGVYYDVAINTADTGLNFILHDASGNNKNCPNDMFFPFPAGIANGAEIWQLQDDCTIYTSVPAFKVGDVNKAKAHWLVPGTNAWPGADPTNTYRLYYAADGGITSDASGLSGGASIPLSVVSSGLSAALKEKYPFIAAGTAPEARPHELPPGPRNP